MNRLLPAAFFILATASSVAIADGPDGLGDLKLGMTKKQVESISLDSTVHLASPLVRYEDKNKSNDDLEVFTTSIKSPVEAEATRASLVFKEGKLIKFSVYFGYESQAFEAAKKMISSKYGEPKTTDTMAEEQCIFRNGANYKIKKGRVEHSWINESAEFGPVETLLIDDIFDLCPASLRTGFAAIKSKNLVFMQPRQKAAKTENPF